MYRLFFILLILVSCKTPQAVVTYDSDPEINFNRILQEEVSNPENGTVGVSLTIVSPKLGLDFSGASGYDSTKKEQVLSVDQPFRIASLTKTFVSTAIMRLYEQGLLDIDMPITTYISKEHIDILKQGGYQPQTITVKHCLMHTSGLYDYAEGGPEYIEEAGKDPTKRWTRTEQIQFAMDHGKPHSLPGAEYHYSDTGYVLLGEIIENITEKGLAQGLRTLLKFNELGMNATWLESLEDQPDGLLPSVRRYLEDLDATHWDNSIDLYGGGGLASNTKDLCAFLQALFNNGIYQKEDTLPIMLLKKDFNESTKGRFNRLGLGYVKGKKSKVEAFLHSGFWGTIFIHFPVYNCSIAVNHTNGDSQVLQRVVDYVQWMAAKQNIQ